MKTRFLIGMIALLAPVVAMAKPHVVITLLQKAVYENPNCKEDGLPKGACLTECEISYPVIDGIEAMSMQRALNSKFEQKALAARCEGQKFAAGLTDDFRPNSRSHTYKMLLNDGKLLSFSEDSYYFNSGAAHGVYSSNGIILDARTGKELTTGDIFDINKLSELNAYITEQIRNDEARVFDTIRKTPASGLPRYVSDTKRAFTLMLDENGLRAVFGIYQIGPYSAGEIDYAIPAQFIKHPHILAILDKKEVRDAQR